MGTSEPSVDAEIGPQRGRDADELPTGRPSVVVSCLDKRHAFEAARAAVGAGMLRTFVTGAAYDRSRVIYRTLPTIGGAEHLQVLIAANGGRLASVPGYFVPCKSLSAVPLVRDTWVRTGLCLLSEIAFDAHVARRHAAGAELFHGFGRYASMSLARARDHGAATVLDAFELHPLTEFEIETRQRRRVGLPENHSTRIRRLAMRRRVEGYEHADVILACLESVRASLVEHGVDASRIRVLPLGADVPTGALSGTSPHGARRSFRLLYVGQLHWFKGLHLLLDAWERLRMPDAELIVVGRPFPIWGEYLEDRMRSRPDIRWIPGLARDELFRLYSEVDAMAFPSLVGGVGMVVYEAMAAGLPVIVPTGEGIVRDGVDGLVAHPEEEGALEAAILLLHRDEALRVRLGQAAHSRMDAFTWERYRSALVSEYRAAASQR